MVLNDIKGKLAIVTGASQGIGKATSIGLLEQKAKVLGIDCNAATIFHKIYCHYECNLESTGEMKKTFTMIRQKTDSIDYLVNVAGVDPLISIEEGDEKSWDEIVNINLRSYYFCIRFSLPMLQKGDGKSIVNMSSINYRLGVPGRSIYSATKAGIIGLTAGLARELGKYKIRINCISPGWIFTERQKKEYFETKDKSRNKKYIDSLFSMQSLKIKIQTEDIANHVLFLLSDSS